MSFSGRPGVSSKEQELMSNVRSERMEQVLSTIVNNGVKAGWTTLGHNEGEGLVREGQVSKILAESSGQSPEISVE